ncbi:MAG: tetratricopeptide repeat protein [Bacteroidetes bacterium]|nr:tetratricopeptide repeat protein [Bacteroidota bacterium]MBT4399489.1 tetratricopeptide repeat protein [Bacteroidota bacterium]MBT4411846.1 tetratricopeptide repeat protein [Bacteroidota bacterium]MBT7462882.1 tetratricopeptide repeat protein [Bacteroidota bacterium]
MQRTLFVFFLALGFWSGSLSAQDVASGSFNYDEALRIATQMAWDGQYDQSRLLCNRILRDKPEYVDARLLLGNTYSWNKQYREARDIYYTIFDYENANIDALKALVDVEIFSDHPLTAVEVADAALEFYPEDTDLLLKKARAAGLSGDFTTAKRALLNLLRIEPTHEEARIFYFELKEAVPVKPAVVDPSNRFGPVDIVNVDTLFSQAQQYAWTGEYGESRYLLYHILEARPEFFQARVLAAQTFAWGSDYINARKELDEINLEATGYYDGILTAIDIEKWDKQYYKALEYCDLGSRLYPDDEAFILRRAEVLELQGRVLEAKKIIYQGLLMDPDNALYVQAYNRLRKTGAGQYIEHLDIASSTENLTSIDADNLIVEASSLAALGQILDARKLCQQVLEIDPSHVDARLLMGNTYAWNQEYNQARTWFDSLLDDSFDNYDLIIAMANVEAWDKQFDKAIERLDYGLDIYPDDMPLALKKSQFQQRMGEIGDSNETIESLLMLDPDNEELRKAYYRQKGPMAINGISAEFSHNRYTIPLIRRWNMYSLKYYRTNDIGTFIGSLNTGYVSNDTTPFMKNGGVQFQIDAFPMFPLKKRYFHLSYAISPSAVFARHVLGAHVYQGLKNGWEVSGGFNYAYYKNATDTLNVLMFDAGITKYFGNNMVTVGARFSPNRVVSLTNPTGVTKLASGYSISLRHFLQTSEDWIQISVGSGVSPDNPLWYVNDPNWNPGQSLNAYSIVGAYRRLLSEKWIFRVYAGVLYEEYLQAKFRNVLTLNMGVIYLFD